MSIRKKKTFSGNRHIRDASSAEIKYYMKSQKILMESVSGFFLGGEGGDL